MIVFQKLFCILGTSIQINCCQLYCCINVLLRPNNWHAKWRDAGSMYNTKICIHSSLYRVSQTPCMDLDYVYLLEHPVTITICTGTPCIDLDYVYLLEYPVTLTIWSGTPCMYLYYVYLLEYPATITIWSGTPCMYLDYVYLLEYPATITI